MILFLLVISLLEYRVDTGYVCVMPESYLYTQNNPFSVDTMIKLPLKADWINMKDSQIVGIWHDTIFNFIVPSLKVINRKYIGFKDVLRVYSDRKGRLVFITREGGFYANGKRSKLKELPDTVNIVNGRKVFASLHSPIRLDKRLFYLKKDRIVMKVDFDTTGKTILEKKYTVLPSFLGLFHDSMLVYTYDGKMFLGDSIFKKGLTHGVARKFNDTIFVYNLRDTLYVYSFPNMRLSDVLQTDSLPFKDVMADFRGNVYLDGKIIYKDEYFTSSSLWDIDGDGKEEVILGRLDGSFGVLKKNHGVFAEFDSYIPPASIYKRYFNPEGLPLFYLSDLDESPFKTLLDTINPLYRDECLYVLYHSSPQFLDSLLHIGPDFLYENIFDIYLAARRLKYVSLFELSDGRTTLILNGKDTLSPEVYYKYVVFPRVLYEFPEKPLFREFFMNDRSFGNTVLEVVREDTTVFDAVKSFYAWAKSFMHFGYMTNDLQPVVIYKKAYGSCGEHSVLSAALLKTILIPVYVAVDMGEDHQWDEFYDGKKWVHFDLTQDEKKAIDNPYASSEGMGGKEVSTVVGVSPVGEYSPITSHGYTKTGRVNIMVSDRYGTPIPYALCVLKSHWMGRNSISFFKYTDGEGKVYFNAGHEKHGYGLDVYSPYGRGGIKNFYIEEDSVLWLDVRLAGRINTPGKSKKVKSKMLIFERNFRTGEVFPTIENGNVFVSDLGLLSNPYLNTIGIVVALDTLQAASEPPEIGVSLKDSVIKNGKPVVFELKSKDNLGIADFNVIIKGKDVNKIVKIQKWNGIDSISLNEDTVLAAGGYTLFLKARDYSGNEAVVKRSIVVENTGFFEGQTIRQDPVGTNTGSWNYVVKVKDAIPFMYIVTSGKTKNMDIDLYLFKDGKVIKKSASPTSEESIYTTQLAAGTYTITVQGWHVPKSKGFFDIKVLY